VHKNLENDTDSPIGRCIEKIREEDEELGIYLESHKFKTVEPSDLLRMERERESFYLCSCTECGFEVYLYPNLPYTAEDIEERFYRGHENSPTMSCKDVIIRGII